MLLTLRNRWRSFTPDVRRHLVNAGVYGMTLDGGITTVIQNLYALRLGFGPELIGLINSLGLLVFAVLSLPSGRIGERYGHHRVMRTGAVVIFAGALLVPITGLVPENRRALVLVLSGLLTNIGLAGYYANAAPYVVAWTGSDHRTSVFSTQSAVFSTFGFAGSLLGGLLPGAIAALLGVTLQVAAPYQITLMLVPLFALIPLRMLWLMREPPVLHEPDPPVRAAAAATGAPAAAALAQMSPLTLIGLFALMRFLMVGGVGSATTFFNVYMDNGLGASTAVIGGFQAAAKLLGVPIALAVPWLTRRFGNARVVLVTALIVSCSLFPMGLIPVWWVAGLSYMGVWVLTPVRYAAFMVISMERTPRGSRGTMNGAQEMLGGLSFALVAFVGGRVIASMGYMPLFVFTAFMSLSGVLLFVWFERRWRRSLAG